MNNVSMYDILTRKILISHSLYLPLPLIFAIWCLPYKTPAVVSQLIRTPFSTVLLFNMGNNPTEPFVVFIGDGSNIIRKKIQKGVQKMKFQ